MRRALGWFAGIWFVFMGLIFAFSQDVYAERDGRVEDLSGTDGLPANKVQKDGKSFYYNYLRDTLDHHKDGIELSNGSSHYWQVKWKSNGSPFVNLSVHNKTRFGTGVEVRLEKWVGDKWEKLELVEGNNKCIDKAKCNFVFEDTKPKVGQIYAATFTWAKNPRGEPVKFNYYLKQNIYDSPASKGYALKIVKRNNIIEAIIENDKGKEQSYEGWYRCEFWYQRLTSPKSQKVDSQDKDCGYGHVDKKKNKRMKIVLPFNKDDLNIDLKYVGKIGKKDGKRLYLKGPYLEPEEYYDDNYDNNGNSNGGNGNGKPDNPGKDDGDKKDDKKKGKKDDKKDSPKTEKIGLKVNHLFDKDGQLTVKAEPKKDIEGEWQASAGKEKLKKKGKQVTFTFQKENIKETKGIIPLKITFKGKDGKKEIKGSVEQNLVRIKVEQAKKEDKKLAIKATLQNIEKATGTFTIKLNDQEKKAELKEKNQTEVVFDQYEKENQLKVTFSGKIGKKEVKGSYEAKIIIEDTDDGTDNGGDDKGDGNGDNKGDNKDDNEGNGEDQANNEPEKEEEDQSGAIDNGQQNDDEMAVEEEKARNNLSNNQIGGELPKTATPYGINLLMGIWMFIIGASMFRLRQWNK